jgi:hypothetical protein
LGILLVVEENVGSAFRASAQAAERRRLPNQVVIPSCCPSSKRPEISPTSSATPPANSKRDATPSSPTSRWLVRPRLEALSGWSPCQVDAEDALGLLRRDFRGITGVCTRCSFLARPTRMNHATMRFPRSHAARYGPGRNRSPLLIRGFGNPRSARYELR